MESFRAGAHQRNRPLNSEPPDLGELNHSLGDPPLYTPLSGAVGDWAIGFAAKTQALGQARWVLPRYSQRCPNIDQLASLLHAFQRACRSSASSVA